MWNITVWLSENPEMPLGMNVADSELDSTLAFVLSNVRDTDRIQITRVV